MRTSYCLSLVSVCLLAGAIGGRGAEGDKEKAPVVRIEINTKRGGGRDQSISPDGKLTVRVVRHYKAQIVNATTGKPAGPLLEHISLRVARVRRDISIRTWAFSPDGKLLATAAGDTPSGKDTWGSVRVWDVASGKLLASNEPDIGWVQSVSFADNKTVVIVCKESSGK